MSDVYFIDARARAGRSLLDKLADLFDYCGVGGMFGKGQRVALKAHFGEMWNTGYLEASFARVIVSKLREKGVEPFLTDTNTLYRCKRASTEDHLATARAHGFSEESLGAPVIISDDFVEVEAKGAGLGKVGVARPVWEADGVILLTHATGHVLYGLGGSVKNLAMGCSSPSGKQVLHSDLTPEVVPEKCVSCGTCATYCPVDAISVGEGEKASIDIAVCVGCGECITVCPEEAIPPVWKGDPERIAEKTAAYAAAVLSNKKGKAFYFNFLVGITPDCDCCDWTDIPIVPDIGVLASSDVVAVDQATVDLIAKAPVMPGSALDEKAGEKIPLWRTASRVLSPLVGIQPRVSDKFRMLHGVDAGAFLADAEKQGVGSRRYTLRTIPEPAQ